jgi:protein involved in polysaccharide export with SLBB domain
MARCVAAWVAALTGGLTATARADAGMFDALAKLPRMHAENFDAVRPPVGWSMEGEGVWTVENKHYQVTAGEGLSGASIYTAGAWTDCFVEVECSQGAGPAGIILQASPDFRIASGGSAYLFSLRKEGSSWQFSISRRVKGAEDFLKPWTSSRQIRSSGNRLAALCYDGLLQFYINEQLAWEGYDHSVIGRGRAGLYGSGGAKQAAVHTFDNLSIKQVSTTTEPAPQVPEPPVVTPPVVTPPVAPATNVVVMEPAPPVAPVEVKEPARAVQAPPKADKPGPAKTDPAVAATEPTTEEERDRSPLLRPGQMIRTTVFVAGKREIDAEVKRVSDNSVLDMPFIGNVSVSGQTLADLNATLQNRYKEFFINPQVVAEFLLEDNEDAVSPWGSVTVLGRVMTEGRVNIPPTQDLTLSAAIQQAGGFNTSAKTSAILITRRNADGKTERITVDFKSLGKRGDPENDVILKPGDRIFVPESWI